MTLSPTLIRMAPTEAFIQMVLDEAKSQIDNDPAKFPHTSAGIVAKALSETLGTEVPATKVVEAAEILLQRGRIQVDRLNPAPAYRISVL
ncbi:hypothetical protein Axi01nite_87190 [Actinoplanes xinjiangensis]|nr:hypothetical protein Axi01nite_87190 [Actinoplanes xinjiangensis]